MLFDILEQLESSSKRNALFFVLVLIFSFTKLGKQTDLSSKNEFEQHFGYCFEFMLKSEPLLFILFQNFQI